MDFVVVDCCPVPADLAGDLVAIKAAIGCTYASVYRGEDPNAQQYLTGAAPCFKHNQAWIYAHYPPGVANPPGFSTHELKNDGVAYPVARGANLEWWQCGIDVDDAHVAAFCAEARNRGWVVTITYPASAVEHHHVNFRQAPTKRQVAVVTQRGDTGAKVRKVQRELAAIERPNRPGVTYLKDDQVDGDFGKTTEDAVRLFQSDHHQTADGKVGPHTRAQLEVAMKNERRRHKIDHLKIKLHNAEDALANASTDAQRRQQQARVDKLKDAIRKAGGKP